MSRDRFFGFAVGIVCTAAVTATTLVGYYTLRDKSVTAAPPPKQPADPGGREGSPPAKPNTADTAPVLRVTAALPGTAPEEIEALVTAPLDEAVRGIEGVAGVRSESRFGESVLTVTFEPDWKAERALLDLRNALANARSALPSAVEPPRVETGDPDVLPVLWLVLESPSRSLVQLTDVARRVVRPAVLAVPGATGVETVGGRERVLTVHADPARLQARALTLTDLRQAVERFLSERGGGFFDLGRGVTVRINGADQPVEEMGRVVVSTRNGVPIYLRDVAVPRDAAPARSLSRLNGKQVVVVAVRTRPGANPAKVDAHIRGLLPDWGKQLPPDIKLSVAVDLAGGRGKAGPEALLAELQFPAGTPLPKADQQLREVEKALSELRLKEAAVCATVLATAAVEPGTGTRATLLIALPAPADRGWQPPEAARAVRVALAKFPGLRSRVLDLSEQQGPPRKRFPVRVVLQGNDLGRLAEWAGRTERLLAKGGSVIDVWAETGVTVQDQVTIDRDKLAQLGIPFSRVMEAIAAQSSGRDVGFLPVKGERIRVQVVLADREPGERMDWDAVAIPTGDGKVVPLRNVATVRRAEAPPVIWRFDGRRGVPITASPAKGVSVEKARDDARDAAGEARKELKLPEGYRVLLD